MRQFFSGSKGKGLADVNINRPILYGKHSKCVAHYRYDSTIERGDLKLFSNY